MFQDGKGPKIDIPRSRSEIFFDILGYGVLIGTILLLIVVWEDLPAEVPAHYNAAGEVDRWGSKFELLILPLISIFSMVMMIVFERSPEIHNYPKRFNEDNARDFYLNSRQLINQIKNMCLIIFSLICLESIGIALDWYKGLGHFLLPIIICLCLIPIVLSFIKRSRIP